MTHIADYIDNVGDSHEMAAHVMPIITKVEGSDEDMNEVTQEDLEDIPILALRNLVLFPGATIPVSIGRKKSQRLIEEAEKKHSIIAAFCQIDSDIDEPTGKDLYQVGTLARIIKVLRLPDDSYNAIITGGQAVTLQGLTHTRPYLRGRVHLRSEQPVERGDSEYDALIASIRETALEMLEKMGDMREMSFAIKNIDQAENLVHFLACNLPFDSAHKQSILEERDIKKRAYLLMSMLTHEAQLVDLKASIQLRTRADLSQQQREHFLQQQLRTIQEELGEGGTDDISELEERAKAKKLPPAAEKQFRKELRKLERLNPQSPDYSVVYTYLDQFVNLPWNDFTADNFDLKKVENRLNRDHYGLDNVKDRILEHLAVLKLRGDLKAPILCLYGPPGVGKTSLGRSIATALNRKYARIALGGVHDEAEIRGHRRTYIGAMPGRIIDALIRCESSNPVIVLDEIDKVGQDIKGDPASALLEALDPEQNNHFHDNYLDVDYDLSHVLFIATANSLSTISQPLLDRMEVIEINGYITEEKVEIARRHLIPKQLKENGLDPHEIRIPPRTISAIVERYTRESGVRELEKKIATIMRKIALAKATQKPYPTVIDEKALPEYLGNKDFSRDKYEGNEFAGVVTGLAWTAVGGEILFVESSLSRGKGEKLTLTGNLGDVMKESAVIALQYLKSHSKLLGIDDELFDKYNVHIHVPEGAIPKDGPSAGVTMVTSLASSFTQRKVRDHLAMTGEITLRGKVLPVGGIKEKILAAKRAGITDIVLCRDNEKDINEIKSLYLKGLTFHYVDTIKDVLDIALLDEKVSNALDL